MEASSVGISGFWIPVTVTPWRFVDVETNKVVISYSVLGAQGGWFMRVMGSPDGENPLLFKGDCAPDDVSNIEKYLTQKLGVIEVERSSLIRGKNDSHK
jgi:hypothetical protein